MLFLAPTDDLRLLNSRIAFTAVPAFLGFSPPATPRTAAAAPLRAVACPAVPGKSSLFLPATSFRVTFSLEALRAGLSPALSASRRPAFFALAWETIS